MVGGAIPPPKFTGPASMHLDELHQLRALVLAAARLVGAAVHSGEPVLSPAHRDATDGWMGAFLDYEAAYMTPRRCRACGEDKPLNAFRRTYSGKLSYRAQSGDWTLRCEACIAARRPTTEQLATRARLADQWRTQRRGESALDYWISGRGSYDGRRV
jgi:hypothetical protein